MPRARVCPSAGALRVPALALAVLLVQASSALPTGTGSLARPAVLRRAGRQATAPARTEEQRLSLRGGGPPVIPLVLAAGAAAGITLKFNEGLREKVVDFLQGMNIELPGMDGGGHGNLRRVDAIRKKLEQKVERTPLKEGYDLRNGTWAYEVEKIEPGCLLLASPDTFRFAGQRQILDQSVVLLVRHGVSGSSGFIINRPTAFTVGDVTKKLTHFAANPLFVGGDLGEGVYMIHGFDGVANSTEVSEGIYYGGSEEGMAMVESGKGTPGDFRFFFKYTAWAPGQLEAEMQAGCWCPVRSSLDLVLKPRVYQGLQVAQYHKVFWHQVLRTLGGRFLNISDETIQKEELERRKLEEWIDVLNDGGANVTVENHEEIELGAIAIATVMEEVPVNEIEQVHLKIAEISNKIKEALTGKETRENMLKALSAVFFSDFKLKNKDIDMLEENSAPGKVLIHEVVKTGEGSALALSPLYIACAKNLGVNLRATNCTAQMAKPFDFLVRWDDKKEGELKEPPIFVNLADDGKVLSYVEALDVLPESSSPLDLNPVPHVQLYSRFMHRLADISSRMGAEQGVLQWLAQLRVLQGAINTRLLITEKEQIGDMTGNILESLGPTLQNAEGLPVSISDLQGKYVGIYFSAQWCAPCKAFTPKLIQTYKHVTETLGKPFEIVFVSSDRSQEAFDQYFGEMPWLALPFQQQDRRMQTGARLAVDSIPKLVLLNPDGTLLSLDGRDLISQDPEGATFPWA
eukprot:CAMPEP_0206228714 /NCGR_PEP_ID=MMETSP0047_2-20121206/9313_1 /ASSEMBLY_ACC=CAM_ASM_000192 /TAXON_ID=195065 /ORGANISM="Chroomonas mesostigmatica_cf, Strain CCMP1168" /LENGTH=744 /DNA_ID=CAMNT_0053651969 /DNA_START=139 /DNA_END=2373 /DNA_ORIENTATION=+